MKENFSMVKLMDMEYIHILMELNMKEIGKTIKKMEKEKKFIQMVLFMMGIIKKGKKWKRDL